MFSSALLPIERASVFYEGLDHPEGLAVHPDGSIWAGGEAGQIYRISSDGEEMVEVANTGGFILGLAFSPNAEWLAACDLLNRCVWRLDPGSGVLSEFARGAGGGDQFKIPNYATFDRDGTLYVSDSGTLRQVDGRILRFDADHSGHGQVWHQGPFNFANGLALSPGGEALYVICSFDASIERIEVAQMVVQVTAHCSLGFRERCLTALHLTQKAICMCHVMPPITFIVSCPMVKWNV